jgi:hypothetical protein
MKVLSLTQPWATLVAIGAKTIETRSWPTNYRGPLAIHAAKGLPGGLKALRQIVMRPWFYPVIVAALPSHLDTSQGVAPDTLIRYLLPLGQIIATCTLDDCFQFTRESTAEISVQEMAFGNYAPGRYGLRLGNIRQLDAPIPARGSLGLWNYEGEL